jgi:hypothetical protein
MRAKKNGQVIHRVRCPVITMRDYSVPACCAHACTSVGHVRNVRDCRQPTLARPVDNRGPVAPVRLDPDGGVRSNQLDANRIRVITAVKVGDPGSFGDASRASEPHQFCGVRSPLMLTHHSTTRNRAPGRTGRTDDRPAGRSPVWRAHDGHHSPPQRTPRPGHARHGQSNRSCAKAPHCIAARHRRASTTSTWSLCHA